MVLYAHNYELFFEENVDAPFRLVGLSPTSMLTGTASYDLGLPATPYEITLTANATAMVYPGAEGQMIAVSVINPSTYTLTFSTSGSSTLDWGAEGPPVISPNAKTLLNFVTVNNVIYGFVRGVDGLAISPASVATSSLIVAKSNADYTNTGGAGSHIYLSNPSTTGQTVVCSYINGALAAKWRTDYAGNISWVAGATGSHVFFTGGDYPTGTVRLGIGNDGSVNVGSANVTGAGNFGVQGSATLFPQTATPAAPSSGVSLYVDSVGDLHALHADGTNHTLSTH